MANNAANLVGAKLLFGTMANNEFTEDINAQIHGDTDGSIRVEANTVIVRGATTINSNLTVTGTITGSVSGNATSATKLATARNIGVNGDASGSVAFDGTANKNIPVLINTLRGVAINTTDTNPTGTSRLNIDGYLHATRVYNAVWNDIADFIEVEKDTPIRYGVVYIKNEFGHRVACRYAEKGSLGIASDTLGFGVGQKEGVPQIPIAIGGFVLAHCSHEYDSGTPLVSNYTGGLTKANLITRVFHPERILATYYKPEPLEEWNGVKVNGRHWVKVS